MSRHIQIGCHYRFFYSMWRKRYCVECPYYGDYDGCTQFRTIKGALKMYKEIVE